MYKIINEKVDREMGYCKVVIQTKEGMFDGFSYCNPQDEFSFFVGIKYAERRAVAALCRHKAKIAKIQYNTVKKIKDDFLYNNTNIPRPIKIKLRDYFNDIEYWTEVAKTFEESIVKDDKKRADILSRYSHTE